ncbi:mechanosensitive ion channel family protein [Pseudooceanicola nanhaiensis]|uniref:mechanosensitive ion channel family protein n=1 Tax=Pseudooceanicola nanhaiensis TaxID=375761 RepID=UPI001CD1B6D7|nr:mechanosensitive ion channel domain-containing protein [Pseudooceanicola nanhaiensis]MCA0919158.1 mechanosensitive ion channel family protein [Pseudooceanicola nanhaiensis]
MRCVAVLLALCLAIGVGSGAVQAQAQLIVDTSGSDAADAEGTTGGVKVILIDENGDVSVMQKGETITPTTRTPGQGGGRGRNSDEMGSMLMDAQTGANVFWKTVKQRLGDLPVAYNEVIYILRASSPDGTLWAFARIFLLATVVLILGILFEHQIFGKLFARRLVVSRVRQAPEGYLQKMPFLVYRFAMGALGTAVSMIVGFVAGVLLFGRAEDSAAQFTVTVIFVAYFIFRMVTLLWRMVLSPFLSQYRIPQFSDRDAKRLFYWLTFGAFLTIFTQMLATWVLELGLNEDIHLVMVMISTVSVSLYSIVLIFVNLHPITEAIRGGRPVTEVSKNIKWASYLWAPLALGYILLSLVKGAIYSVRGEAISVPLVFGAYATILTALIVFGIFAYFIERYSARARELRQLRDAAEAAAAANAPTTTMIDGMEVEVTGPDQAAAAAAALRRQYGVRTFEGLAYRMAGVIALIGGLWACLVIWGVNTDFTRTPRFERLMDISVILFIGYIVYQTFRVWIDSKIAAEQPDPSDAELGDEGGHGSASRLGTLLPLFRNFILIVIAVSILLIILMELGINVSPLFAGAGIVGLAVGFGAQALVRDIFSGAFFLIDDAFRKGEYIDVGDVKGTVETVSVRSFQLRHHLGALHTIPYGEIKSLTNYSRDWVIMKLKLRLTYDTDVEKVRKLVKKLGLDLLEDPELGPCFLQPLKSQGVIEMQDSAMILRVKFMTKPGDQWIVRKRVYQEIRELFAREDIRFANREVTVHIADSRSDKSVPLTEEQKRQIAGAALDMDDEGGEGGMPSDDDR